MLALSLLCLLGVSNAFVPCPSFVSHSPLRATPEAAHTAATYIVESTNPASWSRLAWDNAMTTSYTNTMRADDWIEYCKASPDDESCKMGPGGPVSPSIDVMKYLGVIRPAEMKKTWEVKANGVVAKD